MPRLHFSEGQIAEALKKKFGPPEMAFLRQVRNATGYSGSRSADAIAWGLWPSRGLDVHGFEIKSTRSDWIRELKDPAKAEAIAAYCDFWWIAAPVGVVLDGEVPQNWGHIEINEECVAKVKVQAPRLGAKPLTKEFAAAVIRAAVEQVTPDVELKRLTTEARSAGYTEGVAAGKKTFSSTSEELLMIKQSVNAFEQASGIRIDRYAGEKLGDAVKRLLADDQILKTTRGNLVWIKRELEDRQKDIEKALVALDGGE